MGAFEEQAPERNVPQTAALRGLSASTSFRVTRYQPDSGTVVAGMRP